MRKEKSLYLEALCEFSLPHHGEVNDKQIFATNTLLNITHCLPDILEISNWVMIFRALTSTEQLINKTLPQNKAQ